MHLRSMILKVYDDKCAATVGFSNSDFEVLKGRLHWWKKNDIVVATQINRYVPPKTDDQLGLFHVLCRKIAIATKMGEEQIKDAIKELYGPQDLNPFYRIEEDKERDKYVPKSLGDCNREELSELIEGAFAEGEYLRLEGGYPRLDLWKEYQQYQALRVAYAKKNP